MNSTKNIKVSGYEAAHLCSHSRFNHLDGSLTIALGEANCVRIAVK